MARKKHKENTKAPVKRNDEVRDVSPFASIVLKEKNEEPKKVSRPAPASSGKKPHEIVQGYNPNASFADILYAFEHTGNPYVMPESKKKKIAEKNTDFGAILDQWEGRSPSKKKQAKTQERKSEYKPTKSFADILSQFEGTDKPSSGVLNGKAKPDVEIVEETSFFRKEDEDNKRDPESSWSILGGNESYARKEKKAAEKEERKEYKRTSSPYKATKDFADILSSFEGEKRKKVDDAPKTQKPERKKEAEKSIEILSDNNLFKREDEENKRAANASWSVLGNNESFVRPAAKKEEEPILKEPIKRVSEPYVPTKDFSSILSSFEEKKGMAESSAPLVKEEEVFDEPISANNLFKREDEENKRAANAAWSILGSNDSFVRPAEERKPVIIEEAKAERVSEPYEPTKDFSQVLEDYEKKKPAWSFNGSNVEYDKSRVHEKTAPPLSSEPVKTFEEILQEKGDNRKQRPQYTMAELRRMLPQATLDLHGETAMDSEVLVRNFLDDCVQSGLRKISIITGKGLHSEGGVGVLRELAERVLDESGMVSEKNNAPLRAGGSGALWIILKP